MTDSVSGAASGCSATRASEIDHWTLLARLSRATTVREASRCFSAFLDAFGVDGFGLGFVWRDGDSISGDLANASGAMVPLIRAYLQQGLAAGDPGLRDLLDGARLVLWSESLFRDAEPAGAGCRRAEIAALMVAHGVVGGVSLNLNPFGGPYRAVMSLMRTSSPGAESFDEMIRRDGWALRAASLVYSDVVLRGDAPLQDDGAGVLSSSERLVMEGLIRGQRAREIATALGKSEHTIRNQIASAQSRLGARTKEQAVATALRRGLIRV